MKMLTSFHTSGIPAGNLRCKCMHSKNLQPHGLISRRGADIGSIMQRLYEFQVSDAKTMVFPISDYGEY